MKRIMILFFLCGAFAFSSHGQDTAFQFNRDIPYPVMYFTTNLAGELFTINTDNLLKKYNSNGDSVGVFNDVKKYGRLSYVEAQNPWKTLLFYENYQTIVLLDKYLKNLGSINLSDKNIYNAKAVTTSYDNNIWVFDGREFRIKKIDENGRLLMSSNDLRQLFDDAPVPQWIGDRDGLLYLYDPQRGFFIFDYYGAYKMSLPFTGWKSIMLLNKDIIGFTGDTMFRYTAPMPLPVETKLPPELSNANRITLSAKEIYVLKDKRLSIFIVR